MKNKKAAKWLGFLAITAIMAIIAISMTACKDDDDNDPVDGLPGGSVGGGSGGSLNGTVTSADGETLVLNNGSVTVSQSNVEFAKGTYTTSGNTISMTITQIKGSAFGADGATIGFSSTQWYTQDQVKTVISTYCKNNGKTQAYADAYFAEKIAPLFAPQKGTFTGNTLTMNLWGETTTYTGTLSGGGGGGGGGGSGGGSGGLTITDMPSKYNGKYATFSGGRKGSDGRPDLSVLGMDGSVTYFLISNGRVTIPLTIVATINISRYYGSDVLYGAVPIYADQQRTVEFDLGTFEELAFSNGNATISYNEIFWAGDYVEF